MTASAHWCWIIPPLILGRFLVLIQMRSIFKGITFNGGTSWEYSDNAGSDTGGMLTIFETANGITNAIDSIIFGNGDYTSTSFMLTSDGNGGTLVTESSSPSTPAGNSANTLVGTSNDDIIIANSPGQTLTGGGGNDTFVFKATRDSTPGEGQSDTITDFTHNSDHIDLSEILGLANIQGQVDAANTVDANSISWFVDNAHNQTVVYVNTSATANHVDMEIHLTGTNINLTGSDILHHA